MYLYITFVLTFFTILIPLGSASSALAKLSKATSSGSLFKQQGEKKETPQERLKRIMDKQLNKQSIIFLMFILKACLF